jgi:hypothetical protein
VGVVAVCDMGGRDVVRLWEGLGMGAGLAEPVKWVSLCVLLGWPYMSVPRFFVRLFELSAGSTDACGTQCCCSGRCTPGDCRGCESRTGLPPELSRGP